MAGLLSFHSNISGIYHIFGYGKFLRYDMDNTEYNGIYGIT